MAAVRGLHLPAEEQHGLRAGVGPRQDPLFVHTAQHLQGEMATGKGARRSPGCRPLRRAACRGRALPGAALTVTEPRLCSRLELWLRVGDVPWITRRKWPQMQRSISWGQRRGARPRFPGDGLGDRQRKRSGAGSVWAPSSDTLPTWDGGQRGSEREAQGHNAGAPGGSRRGLGELRLGVQGQHPSGRGYLRGHGFRIAAESVLRELGELHGEEDMSLGEETATVPGPQSGQVGASHLSVKDTGQPGNPCLLRARVDGHPAVPGAWSGDPAG